MPGKRRKRKRRIVSLQMDETWAAFGLFYVLNSSSEWELVRFNTRSAIRGTSSPVKYKEGDGRAVSEFNLDVMDEEVDAGRQMRIYLTVHQ